MQGEIASIPVRRVNNDPSKLKVDNVLVFVDYYKYAKGIQATAYMAEGRMINVTRGEKLLLMPLGRLDRRRVLAQQQIARSHIDHKAGAVWDLVQNLMTKHGLALTTPEPVTT